MSLVSKTGRRRPRARIAMAVLYLLLILGAVTTLYPFLIMISTGFKGPTDQNDNRLIPLFWSDKAELTSKYLDDKYAGDASLIAATRIGKDATPERVAAYRDFLDGLPLDLWMAAFRTAPNQSTGRLQADYQAWLITRYPDIGALNRAYMEENVAFQTVAPPNERWESPSWRPPSGKKWEDWLVFKATLPAEYRIPITHRRMFQEHLRSRYKNRLDDVPAAIRGGAQTFEDLALLSDMPKDDFARLSVTDAEVVREHLATFEKSALPDRYRRGAAEALWQTRHPGEPLPIAASEDAFIEANAGALRREFSTRNFSFVLDYIVLNGRALWNTAIFCALAILTQLTVNPLAAYALSRYPIRASGKILIFLLATMAFPAEVAMIPSFLLLKDLGLLNTFAALVLPSAASGYMIFLLKGFFDSLPQELFEAGQIDGAKESTMMFRIALPLSRPVLGYLALMAFMGAYGAFLYAFLVAQDQRMWTLMVWIYQLQTTAPKSVMMAALALAALPTLAIFLLAQRVILRGIVLPGER